jgi:type VI secretion system secreted protein Hcp
MANVRYFLRLEGIPGESTVEGHEGEIELLSLSWGLHAPEAPSYEGGAGRSGRVEVDRLTALAETSVASPRLLGACATGQHISTATLTGWRDDETGERRQDFLVITLSDVLVSGYQLEGGAGGEPEDEVVLSFSRIQVEIEAVDGSAREQVSWDVRRA